MLASGASPWRLLNRAVFDLLLPTTDAGVAVQFGLLVVIATTSAWFARHNRDVLRLVIGLTLLAAGLMAIRAIH
jgi:hypothetical protein